MTTSNKTQITNTQTTPTTSTKSNAETHQQPIQYRQANYNNKSKSTNKQQIYNPNQYMGGTSLTKEN